MSLFGLKDSVKELKTLPTTFYRLSRLLEDPHCSALEIGREISRDPVIATKILRIANSCFYSFPSRIESIPRAVAIIGFNGIRDLVLATSVIDVFLTQVDGSVFDRQEFWKHSLGCALMAKTMGKYLRNMEVEELFTAGLLHDLGKVIIDQYLTSSFRQIISLTRVHGTLSMCEAENRVLGYDHTQVGAMVSCKWKLPPILVESITCHHELQPGLKYPRHTAVVHIANSLAKAVNLGYSGYTRVPLISRQAWDAAEMKLNMMELVVEDTLREFSDIESVFV